MSTQQSVGSNATALKARLAKLKSRRGNLRGKSLFPPDGGNGSVTSSQLPVIFGAEIALVNVPDGICCGKIGSTKICFEDDHKCSIQSHKTKVKTVQSRTLFIRDGKHNRVFTEPSFKLPEDMPDSMVSDLIARKNEKWGALFEVLRTESVTNAEEEMDIHETAFLASRRAGFTTPKIRIKNDEDVDIVNDATEDMGNQIIEESTMEDERTKYLNFDGPATEKKVLSEDYHMKMSKRLDKLAEYSLMLGTVVDKMRIANKSSFTGLEGTIGGLRSNISKVKGEVGVKGPECSISDPTLWSSVENLMENVQDCSERVSILTDELEEVMKETNQQRVTFDDGREFEGDIDPYITRGAPASRVSPRITNSVLAPSTRRDRDEEVRNNNTRRGGGGGCGSNNGGHGGNNNGDWCCPKCDRMSCRISVLEKKANGTGGIEDKMVFIDGQTLRNRTDVQAWLESYLGVGSDIPCGAFTTPHALLNMVIGELKGDTMDLKDYKALTDLHVNEMDATAARAVMKKLPLLFTQGKLSNHVYAPGNSNTARFKAIPTATDWGRTTDDESLCNKMGRYLDAAEQQVSAYIETELEGSAELRMAAQSLLARSKKFISSVFTFMSEQYETLNSAFKSPAETWNLVCFSVQEVFTNEFNRALACMVARDFTNRRVTMLDAIWTSLNMGTIVDTFLASSFKHHGSLNGSKIQFMLKMANKGGVDTVDLVKTCKEQTQQIKDLTELVKSQSHDMTAIKSRLNFVESRADAACQAANVPPHTREGGRGGEGRGGGRGGGSS